MVKRYLQYLISAVVIVGLLNGYATPALCKKASKPGKSYKEYPAHGFNAKQYVKGMKKGGHNILIWQDPSANLRKYRSVDVADFGGRLLPAQTKFSYTPFIKQFNMTFQDSLKLTREKSPNALRIEGAVVECNPGSRAARYMVGFGAGKASGAVVCEVYEPNQSKPIIRIYARDRGSSGAFGGDSVAFLNHIFSQVALRVSALLEDRIGQ